MIQKTSIHKEENAHFVKSPQEPDPMQHNLTWHSSGPCSLPLARRPLTDKILRDCSIVTVHPVQLESETMKDFTSGDQFSTPNREGRYNL